MARLALDKCARLSCVQDFLPVGDASGGEDQDPLLVLLDAIAGRIGLGRTGLGNGFVYGRHCV